MLPELAPLMHTLALLHFPVSLLEDLHMLGNELEKITKASFLPSDFINIDGLNVTGKFLLTEPRPDAEQEVACLI